MSVPVPQPFSIPILGNVLSIDPRNSLGSFLDLAEKHGEIYKLSFFGEQFFLISTVELLNEICDETRFCKSLSGPLREIRHVANDGLFTAEFGERNWDIAHRTLTPIFRPLGIQGMFDEMFDISTQLVTKWAREGPDKKIDVLGDFTRLTLDTVALCSMGTRFNSFYRDEPHPFVSAMLRFLVECGERVVRTPIEYLWSFSSQRQFWRDIESMRSIAKDLVEQRRARPVDKKDLLNAMLLEKDPQTGEQMSEESVINNIITFLVAGHDTTSAALSYASYYLAKYPKIMAKVQQEVDTVVGGAPLTAQLVSKLPYLEAILKETLRLHPVAPGFGVKLLPTTSEPVLLAGKYLIPPDATVMALLPAIGVDPAAYGEDAQQFRPERMLEDEFTKLPPNSWKPFGNGSRACLGRPFMMQEALVTLALIVQNFSIRLSDPSYTIQTVQMVSIKPQNLYINAELRHNIDSVNILKKIYASGNSNSEEQRRTGLLQRTTEVNTGEVSMSLMILFGSNSGTCEGLAHTLASNAGQHGCPVQVMALNEAVDRLTPSKPVIIITASYEGKATDDATEFVSWLKSASAEKFKGVQYAVFGCGHRDWVWSFQKVPRLIDSMLQEKGGTVIASRGECDTADMAVSDDFDHWQDTQLWPALVKISGGSRNDAQIDVQVNIPPRTSQTRNSVQESWVDSNDLLSDFASSVKRQTTFELPTNMVYETGDYLAVMPMNQTAVVSRVLRRFRLPSDAVMTYKKGSHTTIPHGTAISCAVALRMHFEITTRTTRKNIATISKYAPDEAAVSKLQSLPRSMSVLSILEQFPEIDLPFEVYLSMLRTIRPRLYSISSSPLVSPDKAQIIYTVHAGDTVEPGITTTYLKGLSPGSVAQVSIRKGRSAFRLPDDPQTPVIMACVGTGLAPFLGFIEERAAQMKAQETCNGERRQAFGEVVLFVGCRHSELDRLFSDKIAAWEANGVVKVYYAFSRDIDRSDGCKYVHDRIWRERETVVRLFKAGAQGYICGLTLIGREIDNVVAKIAVEVRAQEQNPVSYDDALRWWQNLRGERYAVEIFD